ncbi:MAG: hypothetical protein LAO79_07765 [Acidobacteriia bacterium]|nr:hypothetical protein [Terriglobia bacterium]
MARGWESKSVEEQIASAKERHGQSRAKLTPEQMETERKRDSLLLQRTRMLREIEKCQDPRYRATLESGLAYLDSQLAGLA